MLTVRVLPVPEVAAGVVPADTAAANMFQFPAVGLRAPQLLPVIVCPTVEPLNETNPLASTVK